MLSAAACPICRKSTELLLRLPLYLHGEGSNKHEDGSRGPIQGDRVSDAAWDGASSMCSGGMCLGTAQRVHYDAVSSMCVKRCILSMCGISTELLLRPPVWSHGQGSNKYEDASRGATQADRVSHAAWDGASSTSSGGLCLGWCSTFIVIRC